MTRMLCVQLADIGEGLERQVHIDIMFLENRTRFGEMSKQIIARGINYSATFYYFIKMSHLAYFFSQWII